MQPSVLTTDCAMVECDKALFAYYLCELRDNVQKNIDGARTGDDLAHSSLRQRDTTTTPNPPVEPLPLPLVVCPEGHLTHVFLQNDPAAHCRKHADSLQNVEPHYSSLPLFECNDDAAGPMVCIKSKSFHVHTLNIRKKPQTPLEKKTTTHTPEI
jgi:hypothetical protein